MTDEEYMDQVIREYVRLDDDPDVEMDFFDFINLEEEIGNAAVAEGNTSALRES